LELAHGIAKTGFSLGVDVECNHAEDASGDVHRIGEIIRRAGYFGAVGLPFEGKAALFFESSFRDLGEVLEISLALGPRSRTSVGRAFLRGA
jgi:hypothetical protein